MRRLTALAMSLIAGLSLAMPRGPVGAQGPTDIDINFDTTLVDYCEFPTRLQVTGQQRVLPLQQGVSISIFTRTVTVTHCPSEVDCTSGVSATVDARGNERGSALQNGDLQTMFTGRNIFLIKANNLAEWDVLGLTTGIYLITGQVTKTFHPATGTTVYEPSPDAELINLCTLIN
jgi:hypothetical protein